MAGDWIKMRCELGRDPDVIQIAAALAIDEFGVVGRLHAIWSWLDAHSETGTNVRIVTAFLDRLTACPGFAEAMRTVNWLGGRDGNLTFPNYAVHNGESAKARASETKRKQKQRKKPKNCPVDDGTSVPLNPGPEKRREEKSINPQPPPLPFEGDHFRDTWRTWKTYRQTKGKTLNEITEAQQLRDLKALGEKRAIAMIEHTISQGWINLREKDQESDDGKPKTEGRGW